VTPGLVFLIQALVVLVLPPALLHISGLKRLVPLVVVQIVVGITLGPSVLGRIAPDIYQTFVNPASLSALSGIGSVAVLLFGLITGLHLDPGVFYGSGRTVSAVVVANIVVPAALGCLAGFWVLGRHPEELAPSVTPVEFAIAIGICTGVTALPVLGALLGEMKLLDHRIGHLALGIAGIKDAILWIVLGVLLTTAAGRADGSLGALARLLFVPIYLIVMVRLVRPLLGRMVRSRTEDHAIDEQALAVVGAVTIASALVTEAMGLHFIIGAFVTGAVMPIELRKPILNRLQAMTLVLLMPFFFTLTGMRTLIDPGSSAFLDVFIGSTAAAIIGIVGGTAISARLMGESWVLSLTLGALLQTKGLMELIVLTILLDAGIISATVFAALILMAVVSTALAMPVARLMLAQQSRQQHRADVNA
jgi:Kef-type K+ transport system membrane component KefB